MKDCNTQPKQFVRFNRLSTMLQVLQKLKGDLNMTKLPLQVTIVHDSLAATHSLKKTKKIACCVCPLGIDEVRNKIKVR